jgi:hypothetical protein
MNPSQTMHHGTPNAADEYGNAADEYGNAHVGQAAEG